jgi:hypothetical protein
VNRLKVARIRGTSHAGFFNSGYGA